MERDTGRERGQRLSVEQAKQIELNKKLDDIIRKTQHSNFNGISIANKSDVLDFIKKNVPKNEQADLLKTVQDRSKKMDKAQDQYKDIQKKHTDAVGKVDMKGLESDLNKLQGPVKGRALIIHEMHKQKAQELRENKVDRYIDKCGGDMFLAQQMISQQATCPRDHQKMLSILREREERQRELEQGQAKKKPGAGPEMEQGQEEKTFDKGFENKEKVSDFQSEKQRQEEELERQRQEKELVFKNEQERLDYQLKQYFIREFKRTSSPDSKRDPEAPGNAEYLQLDIAIADSGESQDAKDYMYQRLDSIFREDLGKQYGPGMSFAPGNFTHQPDSVKDITYSRELRQSRNFQAVMGIQKDRWSNYKSKNKD